MEKLYAGGLEMSGDSKICWECGKTLPKDISYYGKRRPEVFGRYYCAECLEKVEKRDAEELAEYVRLKKQKMLKTALHKLEIQNVHMYEYKEAIEVVSEKVQTDPDKFDSSYEMMAAIVLVHNHIYSKMQYKINGYQVDFCLPEIGVILEIDGDRHKYRQLEDNYRDAALRKALGPGWDIVHIKTDYLDKRAERIPEAINKIIEYRENV